MSIVRVLLVSLLALTAGCASRVCNQRTVSRVDLRWTVKACATAPRGETDVEVTVGVTNGSERARQMTARPIRFSYGRTRPELDQTVPNTWAGEGSADPMGELSEVVALAPRGSLTFRRRFVMSGEEDYASVRPGEALHLGVSSETPFDTDVSSVDFGEFIISVAADGAIRVQLSREPLVR